MAGFSFAVRVYWEDTDAQGVVYYANYFRFMERARTEWLRARGVEQERLRQEHGLIFSVISTGIEFRRPARFDELLHVSADLEFIRGARFRFAQVIRRDDPDGEVLCEGHCEAACLDASSYRPRRLPAAILGESAE